MSHEATDAPDALAEAITELRAAEAAWANFRRDMPLGTNDIQQFERRMYMAYGTLSQKPFARMKARLLKARATYAKAKAQAARSESAEDS
ncbi:MAG: hypothetical protein LBM94_03125 [Propionibacteriaceae bacterium]|jgi:hypothetical protein|nr:hypothetical protein [Propionibacteriaceae bacterium]